MGASALGGSLERTELVLLVWWCWLVVVMSSGLGALREFWEMVSLLLRCALMIWSVER